MDPNASAEEIQLLRSIWGFYCVCDHPFINHQKERACNLGMDWIDYLYYVYNLMRADVHYYK